MVSRATPRLKQKSNIYYTSIPETYTKWLDGVAKMACAKHPADKRFIFINAWNEWGGGAYLEPDVKNGYYFLNAGLEILYKSRLRNNMEDP